MGYWLTGEIVDDVLERIARERPDVLRFELADDGDTLHIRWPSPDSLSPDRIVGPAAYQVDTHLRLKFGLELIGDWQGPPRPLELPTGQLVTVTPDATGPVITLRFAYAAGA